MHVVTMYVHLGTFSTKSRIIAMAAVSWGHDGKQLVEKRFPVERASEQGKDG